jgi:ketosteroid isomerase-like protein
VSGARAAIETFYRAINSGDLELLLAVWADDALVQLDNPRGGVVRGRDGMAQMYEPLLQGNRLVWIQFDDIVEISTEKSVIFAGQERGVFVTAEDIVPVRASTTRCCGWIDSVSAWRLVHHRSSVDEPKLLARNRRTFGFRIDRVTASSR